MGPGRTQESVEAADGSPATRLVSARVRINRSIPARPSRNRMEPVMGSWNPRWGQSSLTKNSL